MIKWVAENHPDGSAMMRLFTRAEFAKRYFAPLDRNHNGVIDPEEFDAELAPAPRRLHTEGGESVPRRGLPRRRAEIADSATLIRAAAVAPYADEKMEMAGAGADVAGTDGAQQSLDPIERLVDQAARFAGLKQYLQLEKPLVGGVDALRQAVAT